MKFIKIFSPNKPPTNPYKCQIMMKLMQNTHFYLKDIYDYLMKMSANKPPHSSYKCRISMNLHTIHLYF